MKKKVALTAAAVAMVGTLAVGGTLAWFTDTETATNVVTTGNVDIAIHETDDPEENFSDDTIIKDEGLSYGDTKGVTPGTELTKRVAVQNTGVNDALIMVKIDLPEEGIVELGLKENSDWQSDPQDENTFYYKKVVTSGQFTNELLSSLIIDSKTGNEFTNLEDLEVKINAYAIQADNIQVGEAGDLHDVDPESLEDMRAAFENKIVDYDYMQDSEDQEKGNDGESASVDDAEGDETL